MDEDTMWKQFYSKLDRQESEEIKEHNAQVQELDGGFFERFGTLLKEQADVDQKEVQEDCSQEDKKDEETADEPVEEAVSEEVQEDIISNAMGWNIEELYAEVLYEILHIIGTDSTLQDEQMALFGYMKEAFKIDYDKHESILETAKEKEAPNILLNVEVIEGKELRPKDANGLSDPFCTLYLTSAPTHRYNTSVKGQTLSPSWEEHFSLPVDNMVEDILCVEVWDFDPAETVREKMTKIGEVKGVKGLRKLMKEIAVTASMGKHDNEFIGSAIIPLKTIPASGQIMWCNLEKKGKIKRQGIVKVKLAFSSEKNSHVAGQEHRHLLRILLLHELETNKTEAYQWNGEFSNSADTILRQHLAQSGLSATDESLAQWVEFSSVHTNHPLSFQIFADLIKKLVQPINNGLLSDEELRLFWDAAKKLLPSCFNSIKKIRKLSPGEKSTVIQIQSLLTILFELSKVQQTENLDLFPPSVYGWISNPEDGPNSDIKGALHDAVVQSAIDWFLHIVEHNKPTETTDEAQLKHQIKVIQLIRTDLQRAIEFHDKLFSQIMLFPYSKTLYIVYENKVSEMSEPVVKDLCMSMKPIKFNEDQEISNDDSSTLLTMGTTLFELYLVLQRFAVLGTGLCPADMEALRIQKFHIWFHRGVAQWLDIAVYKAMQRVNKAVELDQLKPVDSSVKYSSSAVDTLSIFYQIKIFWQQLSWPDIEGSYTFVAKIMDDICRCCVYYADNMSRKVDNLGDTQTVYEKKFEVTNEWCLAINNIDYVRQSIHPFLSELGMEDIVKSLADFKSPSTAEHCRQTLQLVIDNAIDTVKNKILDLLEVVAVKMTPSINRFLMEGAELLNQESNSVDRLMQYLEDNLVTLSSQLNADNFDRILSIIFEKIAYIVYDLVEASLEKRRPPSFFANLHVMLNTLIGFFKQGEGNNKTLNTNTNNEILAKIEKVLTLHGMETWQLIHQCHLERFNEQQEMTIPRSGMITVRMQFVYDLLRVQIMNARNIHPMDDNGSCDPYVKIHLIPEEKFLNVTKPRTKTQKKNLFPLFDETFSIQLNREQREGKDAMIHFIVKDQDFLGMSSEFVAEAYFPFSGIPTTTMETNLEEISQIHLKLSKPTQLDSPAMKALDHRQGEKLAKDFIKKQKAKSNSKIITNGNSH